MPHSQGKSKVLDREFLGIRAKLIDLAATLDRIDRGEGSLASDPRVDNIRRSLHILAGNAAGRANEIQLVFSLQEKR